MNRRLLQVVWNWRDPAPDRTQARSLRGRLLIGVLVPWIAAAVARFGLGHRVPALVLVCIGAAVLLVGLAAPGLFRRLERAGAAFGRAVGGALAWLLLVPVFLLVMLPGAVILRLRGRDPLQRRLRAAETTYWIRRRQRPAAVSYARQFLVEDAAARAELRPVQTEGGGAR